MCSNVTYCYYSIYHQIQDISLWTNSTLNNILVTGNNLYSSTNDYLLSTDVPDMVSIFDKVYSLQYSVLMPIVNKQQLL